jgi:outer membrane protein
VHRCSSWTLRFAFLVACCGLAAAGNVLAQEDEDSAGLARPLWEVGAFGLGGEQLAYPGSDTRLRRSLALPYGIYRGKVFRAGEEGLSARAVKTPTTVLDIGFSGSFGSNSNEVEARQGMDNLGTLIEFGPRLRYTPPPLLPATRISLSLPLRGVFDASNDLFHRGMAFEPAVSLGWRPWNAARLGLTLGAIYGDRRLASHFYGVNDDEVIAPAQDEAASGAFERPAFEARGGLIATRLSLSASTWLNRDVRLSSYLRFESVKGAANEASPLVRQAEGYTAGVALSWTLFQSSQPAQDD